MRFEVSTVTLAVAAIAVIESAAYVVSPLRNLIHKSNRRPLPLAHYGVHRRTHRSRSASPLFSDPSDNDDKEDWNADDDIVYDPNRWIDADETSSLGDASWEESLARREDGSLWSSFASSNDDDSEIPDTTNQADATTDIDDGEAWLDALAGIAADEVEFMSKEADRADKVRQMQEMGYSSESIRDTLGVATDTELEEDRTNEVLEAFKEESFGMVVGDDVDQSTVESHSQVEWDEEANEPVRAQHVYVDEVTCIGCTNCAMIAQSTFFMEGEHGRARVFQQWGDDAETIEVAIQTCPVDCIHYIPYDELKRLEIERRGQNINNKARLVNQSENTGSQARYGGGAMFTEQQIISGNMGSRCNNCPSRGCKNCPMFGVGLNPEFQKRENMRLEKKAKAEMKKKMESQNKRAEL